ncbi:MAG: PhzF family phenazine biosynthesis protein [Kangiella sp.]|nr:PhzF family phenazine biosynthesis protein [Kangiella sp.]
MEGFDGKSVFHVSVFSGDYFGKLYAGTEALIFLLDEPISRKEMQDIAKRKDISATCFVWPADKNSSYHIRFFNPDTEIQLCGHGLLAAAKVLHEVRSNQSLTQITFITQSSHIRTRMDDKQQVWIGFKPALIEPASIPNWAEDCCNILPVEVSKVGPSNGYWIFEWPEGFDLKQLAVSFDKLTFATERALIATTRSQAKGFDYDLRYFAPQHGVNEDKATGSANRILGSYWNNRLKRHSLKAQQLSDVGAIIDIEYESPELSGAEDGTVWISGKVIVDA